VIYLRRAQNHQEAIAELSWRGAYRTWEFKNLAGFELA